MIGRNFRSQDIGLVNWQSRKTRRSRPRMGVWAILAVAVALIGAAVTVAQVVGWLHLPGRIAYAPAVFVAIGLSAQIAAAARTALEWLGG